MGMDGRLPGAPAPIQPLATITWNARWLHDNHIRSRPSPWSRGARTMANHISPAAQLFRAMAELIDHDHTSQTHHEAVTKAAAALAARASTQQLVAGPLWQADGATPPAAAPPFFFAPPRTP